MSTNINAKELNSRLWTEWKNGMKIMAESLLKDSVDISGSGCTIVLGNENFIQRAVMYLQRKSYIGKFGTDDFWILFHVREPSLHV